MTDGDLFDHDFSARNCDDVDRYPHFPGHRGDSDTAIDAALALAPKLGRLQQMVLAVVEQATEGGVSSDEIGERLGWDKWAVRPRAAELRRAGSIVDSKMRRTNESGRKAIVWVAKAYAPATAKGCDA